MENQSSSPMDFLLLEDVQFFEVQDDGDDALLSQWQFVDVVDTEVEEEGRGENCGNDDDDDNGVVVHSPFGSSDSSNSLSFSPDDAPIQAIHYRLLHPDVEMKEDRDADVDDEDDGERRVYDNDDDEDEDEDDGYGLDDELVPWSVSKKFERQRMRKLGKRGFAKMQSAKRSPYLSMKPGCVHGKHGMGLKHNF